MTFTALKPAAAHVPVAGGDSTVQVGVAPRRLLMSLWDELRSVEIGELRLQAPVVTVCDASLPYTPASAALSAVR